MIIGPTWIWLHFPKCAGTSVEKALANAFKGKPGYSFDEVSPTKPMIWHETIPERQRRDSSFTTDGKKIIACIRRLPYWILSRVQFEAARKPGWIATREMILTGRFHEQSGFINHADYYVDQYNRPAVDEWIRSENVQDDISRAVGQDIPVSHTNRTGYIHDLSFWFTKEETRRLYDACPKWSALEARVYGSLLQ